MKNNFKEINFNPYNNNPIDYIDNDNLYTLEGKKIIIKHDLKFEIYFANELKFKSDSNIQVCYFLNTNQSGMRF